MFTCFNTISAGDRQTGRRTDGQTHRRTFRNAVVKTAVSIAARCKGLDRTVNKKRRKSVTFHLFGDKPRLHRFDISTCAKFRTKILRHYSYTGSQIFDCPIDFPWILLQCSANALPVIMITKHTIEQTHVEHLCFTSQD